MFKLKKLDILIVICLFIFSFTPNIIFSINNINQNTNSTYAHIEINGDTYDDIYLNSSKEQTIEINTELGSNTLKIENNKISIINASCRDHLCMHQEDAYKIGDSIICLPNKLIIEIKGDNDNDKDFILSY